MIGIVVVIPFTLYVFIKNGPGTMSSVWKKAMRPSIKRDPTYKDAKLIEDSLLSPSARFFESTLECQKRFVALYRLYLYIYIYVYIHTICIFL